MPKVLPEYKAQARDRIIAAARKVFHRRGFAAVTMEDIATELGVSKGAIYLYFPSRAGLLRAIQTAARREASAVMAGMLEKGDVAEDLAGFMDQFLSGVVDPSIWHSLLAEAHDDPEIRKALLDDRRQDARAMRRFLLQLRERGRISPEGDLDARVTLVVAALQDAATQYLLDSDRTATRRRLVRALRVALGT
jgi:AcrR family transcriptional regulator